MLHNLENKSIGLGLEKNKHENGYFPWMQILEAKDAIFPNILENPKPLQWLHLSSAWIPLIVGTYFRFIVYEYLFQQYKKKELTSVNKLSLTIVLADHLSRTSGALATTLDILNGESLHHVFGGDWICTTQRLYGIFAFYYSFIGSLGISIYRILLIKHRYFVKDVIVKDVILEK